MWSGCEGALKDILLIVAEFFPVVDNHFWIGGKQMPVIHSIAIRNFKGASNVQIELAGKVISPVITLIGLNESGKTTILEALSYFVSEDSSVSSIFEGVHSKAAINALIPIHRKAAFTDVVSITAKIELTQADFNSASEVAKEDGHEINESTFPREIEVSQVYKFVDQIS